MKCPTCKAENPADARFCGTCGHELTPAKPEPKIDFGGLRTIDEAQTRTPGQPAELLAPGTVFANRYEILQVVGEGGMGVVYRAKDNVTDREVALKLIRSDRLGGKDAVKRLIREGVTSRDIRHPNVVAVYDVGESDGQPYMSMEFLGGQSLRGWNSERMRSGADCSMRTAANVIGQILDGLEAAHKAGVIHRDLKPENVMLMSTPNDNGASLKILDFGIARAGASVDTGATGIGTPRYMAPEQITAPDAAQASADLFSLSVMFYELLVGVVPVGHWQPPSGGRSDVSPKIDELIQKGLSNNPKARPQTVADYRRAMEDAMKWQPAPTPPPPGPIPSPEPARPTPKPEPIFTPPAVEKKKFDFKKIPIWVWVVGGIFLVIGAIGSMMPENSGDGRIVPEPVRTTAPPVGPQSPFAKFNGNWNDNFGNTFSVSVDGSGRFSGRVTNGPAYNMQISGQFSSPSNAMFSVTETNGRVDGPFTAFLNTCDLEYSASDQFGNVQQQAMHINHPPVAGAPCPF
jgi:serine/threonine protein kinase